MVPARVPPLVCTVTFSRVPLATLTSTPLSGRALAPPFAGVIVTGAAYGSAFWPALAAPGPPLLDEQAAVRRSTPDTASAIMRGDILRSTTFDPNYLSAIRSHQATRTTSTRYHSHKRE